MAGGHTTGITGPAGLAEIGTAINQNNQQARTWIRRVQQGDGASWSFSEAADTVSAIGIELQDAGLVQMKSQFTLSGGSTQVANPLSLGASDWTTMIKYVPSLYYVFVETDNTPTTITPTSDFLMFAIPPAANHPCYLFRKKTPVLPNDGTGFGNFYTVTGQTVQGTIGMGVTVGGLVY